MAIESIEMANSGHGLGKWRVGNLSDRTVSMWREFSFEVGVRFWCPQPDVHIVSISISREYFPVVETNFLLSRCQTSKILILWRIWL